MKIALIPVDKEQPALPALIDMHVIPWPGDQLILDNDLTVRVVSRAFSVAPDRAADVVLAVRKFS